VLGAFNPATNDAARNLVYVPQVAPASVVGPGGDTTSSFGCASVAADHVRTLLLDVGRRRPISVAVIGSGGLSMGDIHWSQGDGEITFCGAIEMAGWIDIGVDLIKDGVNKYGIINPIFKPSPIEPRARERRAHADFPVL
jgi:hypothetical protein